MANNEMNSLKLQLQLKDCELVINRKLKTVNFKIINYDLGPIKNVLGYFGEHLQVTILFNKDDKQEKTTCFAKFFPRAHLQVDYELVSGAFEKEIFTYSFLFKKIQKAGINLICGIVPECYFTRRNSVLIFEDLTIRDFKSLPRNIYLDYDHAVLIVKALAKLHAASLIYEIKQSDNLSTYFDSYNETFYSEKETHKGRKSFLASLKGLYTEIDYFNLPSEIMTTDQFKIIIKDICYKIFELVKPSKKFKNVICHGDLWSANILIKYSNSRPVEAMFVDFQIVRYAPPAHDLMGFLYITTSREFRNLYIEDICNIYYDELHKNMLTEGYNLSSLIPRNDFEESCKVHKVFGVIQTATYYQLIQVNNNYMDEVIKDSKRWSHILYEDRSELVLENCKNDENYRSKLKETLENIKDVCEEYILSV